MTARSLLVGPMLHLGTVAPFRELSQRQLTAVALACDEIIVPGESWLTRQGEPTRAMLMIVDGYADLVGEEGAKATLGPGDLVGFPEVLLSSATGAGVRAQADVMVLRLGTDELRELCEQNFAILAELLAHLAGRVAADPDPLVSSAAGRPGPGPAVEPDLGDRVGRMLALHRARLLPSDSMDALAELADRLEPVSRAAGEELWAPGRVADGFWVIASGEIERSLDDGARRAIGWGGVPGFVETLAGIEYRGAARVTRPTTALYVPIDPFMDVIEDHFELAFSLLGGLADHVLAD